MFDFKHHVYIFLAFYFIFHNSSVLVINWFQWLKFKSHKTFDILRDFRHLLQSG